MVWDGNVLILKTKNPDHQTNYEIFGKKIGKWKWKYILSWKMSLYQVPFGL